MSEDEGANNAFAAAHRAQSVFRAVMTALSRPGRIEQVTPQAGMPPGLDATMAALLLTLADFETPVWLDARVAADPAVVEFIRFHCGAPIVAVARQATFALVTDATAMPPLADFAQGDPEYPDRSTTVLLKVASFSGEGLRLHGPGVDGVAILAAQPLPQGFVRELAGNRARYPLGVDLILVENGRIAALPRSTTVTEAAACT